ncbi:hypothetical protein V2J09_009941 [Rumex salicifolius]
MATTANPLIHSLKLLLMSTGVLFIAILLTPQIFNFTAAQLPTIWSSFRSWLRPPYLYVIINGIIITIAASSRIHHHYKHPHAAASPADDFHSHDVHFRSAEEISDEAYSYDKPKSPIQVSPFPVPMHEPLASFNFSFGDVKLEDSSAPEFNKYEETTKFGARETGIDEIDVYDKMILLKDQVPETLRNYERPSVEPELVARRSVRKTQSPPPQPTPLARQETFEIVSSFFQTQMEKPFPSARIDQNRKQSTLTSLNETATFGGRESGVVKKEKVENHDTALRKTPSPPPRTAPLARQETSEIVSSFFQSQIEKTSPMARFGQNRRESKEGALISLNEKATFGGVNAASKEEKAVRDYTMTPSPSAPLARQETSEIVSSFFQSQIEKPPASARFGHNRKPTRSSPEGGKALRVAKPKRSETLESTWRTITEGRHMPLTRHLKKSDTWENQGRQPASSDPSSPSIVKKSDTFTDRTNQSAKILKKEPSLSQDELNRRVEAFINKVNEEMRLQRQQSMQKFKDTTRSC